MAARTIKTPCIGECLCCKKKIYTAYYGGLDPTQSKMVPLDATVWKSSGNYGSGVFDPMDSSELILYVCDKCLTSKKSKLSRLRTIKRPDLTEDFKGKDIFGYWPLTP